MNFIDNNIYIITKLLAPATSKMTHRGGGKGYTLTTREKYFRVIITLATGYQLDLTKSDFTELIIKIIISSLVIGLKMSYFPLIRLPSCYRTVCYWIVCYWTVCYRTV